MLKAELFDELNYEFPVLSSYIAFLDIPVILTNSPGFGVDYYVANIYYYIIRILYISVQRHL